jgi:UDP-glucose 4-epimerase
MKNILISGVNSIVGNSFEKWCAQFPGTYNIQKMSMRNIQLENANFSQYDVIFYVSGIAHISANSKMEESYFKINRDLTISVAKKAKFDGVKQFIFMSSIIVYGNSSRIKEDMEITSNTIPQPTNYYGKSKLEAEMGILELEDENFKVVIIRSPMIYGKNSKGNYAKLSKFVKFFRVFPNIKNIRSMIHIDNLCEFVRLMIDNSERGIFYPQNEKYVCTSEMVKEIGHVYNKNIYLTNVFNLPLYLIGHKIGFINRVFGNIVYEHEMSQYKEDYQINNFRQSIIKSEKNE